MAKRRVGREWRIVEHAELIRVVGRGEDSKNQFKLDFTNAVSLAIEMVAFSNMGGGRIIIGVRDTGKISGLTREDIGRLNELVSNAASQMVRPPINPFTENVDTPEGLVMVVTIEQGISKPYMDNGGVVWVKSGADKRRVTSREEIQRMFLSSSLKHGDEVPVPGMTIADLDINEFRRYLTEQDRDMVFEDIAPAQVLHNMNLMKDGVFNVAGALLFTYEPQHRLPVFIAKCISYPGPDIHVSQYSDSEDISGNLRTMFKDALGFVTRNLARLSLVIVSRSLAPGICPTT